MHRLHLLIGLGAFVFFIATGFYLRFHDPPLDTLETGPHLLFRSGHIYLLFGGLLNLVAGLRGPSQPSGRLAGAGSLLLLSAPLLLGYGFCTESTDTALDRPVTKLGVFAAVAGVLVLLLAAALAGRRSRSTPDRG